MGRWAEARQEGLEDGGRRDAAAADDEARHQGREQQDGREDQSARAGAGPPGGGVRGSGAPGAGGVGVRQRHAGASRSAPVVGHGVGPATQRVEHPVGRGDDAAALRGPGDRLLVVGAGEVGRRVGHQERLHVAHERLHGGHHAADVRVDARDQQLVAARVGDQLGEVAALEGAVAPLGQHLVAGLGRELVEDRHHAGVLGVGGGRAAAPEVVEQTALRGGLLAGLRGVDDGDAEHPGAGRERGDVLDAAAHRLLGAGERGDEVALHVVDEQHCPRGVGRPVRAALRQLVGLRQGVGRDGRQAHDGLSSSGSGAPDVGRRAWSASAARSARRLVLPTPVAGKASTTSTVSGTL